MSAARWCALVAVLLLAPLAGLYLAGWLLLVLLDLDRALLAWNTFPTYLRVLDLPQMQPYRMHVAWAGVAGTVPVLLAIAVLGWRICRRRPEALHGDAGFARLADLKKAGLLRETPDGIVLGRFKGHYVSLGGTQHVIAMAPTRSGKTTSIAIPVLLSYGHSAVVLDVKGELYRSTSGWRASQGQQIHVWAPYDEEGRTHRFNPLSLLLRHAAPERLAELQTIAAILYPDAPGRDPFWTTQARAAFTGFAGYLFEAWDHLVASGGPSIQVAGTLRAAAPDAQTSIHFPSLERVLLLSSPDGTDLASHLHSLRAAPFASEQTRTVFANLAGLAEQTLSSVIATVQAPLQQFLSPLLAAATNATDFDITQLRRRPTTLYVIIPTRKLDESRMLLNIFFSTVIGNNLDKQLGETPDLKHQVLMLMDEFTAMGRVDVWAKRISVSASYGVRDLCIIQSRSQLTSVYGEEDAQNFIVNHGAQVGFTPREQADAQTYSEMLGYRTVRRKTASASRGAGGRSVSYSRVEERRALMLPQEVKQLPADEQLIFYEGCKPIRCRKNWYFKDKVFRQRAQIPPLRMSSIDERAKAAVARCATSGDSEDP